MPFRACRTVFFSGGADARKRFLLFPARRLQRRVHLFGGNGLRDMSVHAGGVGGQMVKKMFPKRTVAGIQIIFLFV